MKNPVNGLVLGMMSGIGFAGAENVYYVYQTLEQALEAMKETGKAGYLVMPIYNNVVRMAMTPFLHGCFSAHPRLLHLPGHRAADGTASVVLPARAVPLVPAPRPLRHVRGRIGAPRRRHPVRERSSW